MAEISANETRHNGVCDISERSCRRNQQHLACWKAIVPLWWANMLNSHLIPLMRVGVWRDINQSSNWAQGKSSPSSETDCPCSLLFRLCCPSHLSWWNHDISHTKIAFVVCGGGTVILLFSKRQQQGCFKWVKGLEASQRRTAGRMTASVGPDSNAKNNPISTRICVQRNVSALCPPHFTVTFQWGWFGLWDLSMEWGEGQGQRLSLGRQRCHRFATGLN